MLQTIRDRSQGLVALLIIIFICITFALWGVHNYFNGSSDQKPVVKVNGSKITQQQFNLSFDRFRDQQLQQNPDMFSSQQSVNEAKKQVLDSMITSELLTQSANKNGFRVGQDLIEVELANMPVFQVDGYFSKTRFEQVLANMMFSEDQFFEALRNSILLAQVRAGFISTSFILPYQVDTAIALINQKRSFNSITIPAKRFEADSHVSEQEALTFYQAHQKLFNIPAAVSLDYIAISLPDLENKIKPTDAQLQQYYQENLNHYTTPKKWNLAHILIAVASDAPQSEVDSAKQKAQSLYSKLKAGASFEQLAQENSDDTATARKGGQMSIMTLLQLDSSWQKQLVGLKTDQLSLPFKTAQGYEIVKVLSTIPAVVQPFSSIQAKVRDDYIKQTAEKQFSDFSDQLANLTFEHPNSLDYASKQLDLPIQSTDFFNQQGGDDMLTKNAKLLAAAFSPEIMNQGANSDVMSVSDTQAVVIRLKKKIPVTTKSFSEVKQSIVFQLMDEKERTAADKLAQHIFQQLKQGYLLDELAKKNGLTVTNVAWATRNNNPHINQNLVVAAFNLPRPTDKKVSAMVLPLAGGDSAVLQLTAVQDGSTTSMPEATKKFYMTGMSQGEGLLNYTLYLTGLKRAAAIKHY